MRRGVLLGVFVREPDFGPDDLCHAPQSAAEKCAER